MRAPKIFIGLAFPAFLVIMDHPNATFFRTLKQSLFIVGNVPGRFCCLVPPRRHIVELFSRAIPPMRFIVDGVHWLRTVSLLLTACQDLVNAMRVSGKSTTRSGLKEVLAVSPCSFPSFRRGVGFRVEGSAPRYPTSTSHVGHCQYSPC